MRSNRGILIHHIQSGLPSLQRRSIRFLSSIRWNTPSHGELEKLYGEQNQIWRVMAKCMRSGQVHHLARWQLILPVMSTSTT